ncbi:MAG TPA: hypothetical protein VFO41_05040 [Alphaproteobacteria bacterium]|nr:hypothetical protein [Alphaproteobacteria bacterium]
MRAIKFLVIAMGLVLIVGFTVVAYEIVRRSGAPEREVAVDPVVEPATNRPFAASLDLPAEARVGAVAATDARVVVHVIMPDGGDILYSLDPVTGTVAGTMRITGQE